MPQSRVIRQVHGSRQVQRRRQVQRGRQVQRSAAGLALAVPLLIAAGVSTASAEPTRPPDAPEYCDDSSYDGQFGCVYELELQSVTVVDKQQRTIRVVFTSPNPDDHGFFEFSSDTDDSASYTETPEWDLPAGSDTFDGIVTVPEGADRMDIIFQTELYDTNWLGIPLRQYIPEFFEDDGDGDPSATTTTSQLATDDGPETPGTVQTDGVRPGSDQSRGWRSVWPA